MNVIKNGTVLTFRDSILLRSVRRGEFMVYTSNFEKFIPEFQKVFSPVVCPNGMKYFSSFPFHICKPFDKCFGCFGFGFQKANPKPLGFIIGESEHIASSVNQSNRYRSPEVTMHKV